jgi:hypothetical protein
LKKQPREWQALKQADARTKYDKRTYWQLVTNSDEPVGLELDDIATSNHEIVHAFV